MYSGIVNGFGHGSHGMTKSVKQTLLFL